MKLRLFNPGNADAEITVADNIFAADFNEPLIHQVVTAFMAGARSGTKGQKTRAEVSGGGRKPWRQKGTGRARAGTIRSPIWRGGGVTFAAKPKCYAQKLNRKMYRGAMRSILAELVRQDRLGCIEDFSIDKPRTKSMIEKLKALSWPVELIVIDKMTKNIDLSTRNIPWLNVIDTAGINPYLLIRHDKILMTKSAITKIEGMLA